MTAFEIIRESVDIIDAAGRYGIDVNRSKKALCPFHDDRNPSLSFKGQRFKCFGCGKGGDVIDLVGSLINASPMETAREINHTYGLRIDMDKPEPSAEVMRRKQMQAGKKAFAEWENGARNILGWYLHLLSDWRKACAPKHPEDELDPRFAQALDEQGYIEYIFEAVFIEGNLRERILFYIQSRDMVLRIAKLLIKEYTQNAGGVKADNNPSGIAFPFESVAAPYPQRAA